MNIDWNKVKDGLTTMDVLKEENKELKFQLQQKENIIKEVREYIKLVATDHDIMNNNEIIYTQMQYEEIENLLEILDKDKV